MKPAVSLLQFTGMFMSTEIEASVGATDQPSVIRVLKSLAGRWQYYLSERFVYLGWVAVLGTVIGLGHNWHFVCDWFVHFRWQLLVVLGLGLIATWRVAARNSRYCFAGALLFNAFYIGQDFFRPTSETVDLSAANLSIVFSNINAWNETPQKLSALVTEIDPDIVGVVENSRAVERQHEIQQRFPYAISSQRDRTSVLMTLYSRYPISTSQVDRSNDMGMPTIKAEIEHPDGYVTVILTHPPPPRNGIEFQTRRQILLANAQEAALAQHPVILMGDFNLTPYTDLYGDVLQQGNLIDTRAGRGFQFSWPSNFFPFFIPIDHVFVSSNIGVAERKTGPRVGSDHLPLIVKLKI